MTQSGHVAEIYPRNISKLPASPSQVRL